MRLTRRIGSYEVLEELGRGGMAIVYLARQSALDRLVALKELSTFRTDDPDVVQRFLRESRVVASLNHPSIVTVFDFFEYEATPYIAMEHVPGGSLRSYVGRLDLAQVGGVVEAVLSALGHAEEHGIVHRDIKPENLLITGDGRVKVTDFGIAKALQAESTMTQTGMAIGTPTYMAPEQAMATDVGPWTDLYSFGCVLFELFAGHPPFAGDSAVALLYRHVHDTPPSLETIDPEIDPGVASFVARLLAKDPAERPSSAAAAWEVWEDLITRLLGPRWRRDSRLGEGSGHERAPAAAESMIVVTPPPVPPEADDYEDFERPASAPRASPDFDTGAAWEQLDEPAPVESPAAPDLRLEPPPVDVVLPAPEPLPAALDEAVPLDAEVTTHAPAVSVLASAASATPFAAPVNSDFQYLHGPLAHDEGGVPLLGNDAIVQALKERLVHSRGGSFLLTGFRGVGKTTVVLRALDELQAEHGALEYLPIVLSVARPMTADELLFEVVRRLFEALTDTGILDTLEPDVRHALLLAYARTSMAFKETTSQTRETTQSLSLDVSRLGVPGVTGPKLGVSRKRADSLAREASFLAYSHGDVEHDFLRILALLDASSQVRRSRRRRGLSRLRRRRAPWEGHLVVVLDELDKITSTKKGVKAVNDLLMALKNLLTTRNAHFVFVGGPELHDTFMRDVARGNSVYESVFACHVYVPCLWDASEKLVAAVVEDADDAAERLPDVIGYFNFKARGIPRLLLRELNSLVRWVDGRPEIAVDDVDAKRLAFYAGLQKAVNEFVDSGLEKELLSMPIDRDRWRLSAYYITDWILRRGSTEFTVADILADKATATPLVRPSAARVEKLIGHLQAHKIVRKVYYQHAGHTVIGDARQADSYRVSPAVVAHLVAFARRNERDRAELAGVTTGPAQARTETLLGKDLSRILDGRYDVDDLIGVGGVGRVYRGSVRGLGGEVAIKILAPQLVGDASARGRWRREAEVAMRLEHDHIVRTYDVIEHDGEAAAIVMELIDGPSLRDVLPLRAPAAVAVITQLLSALEYMHERGLVRFDLKPENVVFKNPRCAVIVDLGLVKPTAPQAGEFRTMMVSAGRQLLVGTPGYMSPEQAAGGALDIRSDVYCIGLLLYETIVGRQLRELASSPAEILLHLDPRSRVLAGLELSDALRGALTRALAIDPGDRFAGPEEMSDALLRGTPEGVASVGLGEEGLLLPRLTQPTGGRLARFRPVRNEPPAT